MATDGPRRARGGRRTLTISAAALVLVIAALVVALVTWGGSGNSDKGSGGDTTGIAGAIGWHWKLTELVDKDGPLAVPSSINAGIGFTHDGHVIGDDSINVTDGRYVTTASGYSLDTSASSAEGYVGHDETVIRVITGMGRLLVVVTDDAGPNPAPILVTANVEGDTLVLEHADRRLTFVRDGTEPDLGIPSSTNTAGG